MASFGARLSGTTYGILKSSENLGPLSVSWSAHQSESKNTIQFHEDRVFWSSRSLLGLRTAEKEIVGVFRADQTATSRISLVYISPHRLPLPDDELIELKLEKDNSILQGTTLLWKYKKLSRSMSARYMPLFTQGSTIGDTAQTLAEGELLLSTFGALSYGWRDSFSISTNLTADALGSPNMRIKTRAYQGDYQTWSVGFSLAQEKSSDEKLMNIDLMWDSVLSDSLIAHSILSAAVITFDEAENIAALKSYGSSSIQTGYEYVMSDWGRILAGPSYNIEQKAIGGYFSYVKIYDRVHVQFSITSNNIRNLRFSAKEGYLAYLEAYWRW